MFETVLSSVVSILRNAGINACVKYPETKTDRDSELVCVSLRSGKLSSSGCGNYIGICEDGGTVRELYGSRAELVFSLELYSPARPGFGPGACVRLFDRIAALMGTAPQGLKLRALSCGEALFDTESRMFCSVCELKCGAYLLREAEPETGSFTDFILRGEIDSYEC